MLATLALASALSLAPGQASPLQLTNVRATYGFLGPTRPTSELLPGDAYFVSFDIENLSVSDGGKVRYSMGMKLSTVGSDGKVVYPYKKEPQEMIAYNSLGGKRMPAFAVAEVGTETAPGDYTLEVNVTDLETKKSETLTRKFKVLKKEFGLVRLQTTYIHQAGGTAPPAPPLGVTGQSLLLNCHMVGFERDAKTKQPNLFVEIRVLDKKTGQPTLAKPFTDEVTKDVDPGVMQIPLALPLELNRPGEFTVQVKATDRVTKKTKELSFPITVYELK